jgi:hypothetical protein
LGALGPNGGTTLFTGSKAVAFASFETNGDAPELEETALEAVSVIFNLVEAVAIGVGSVFLANKVDAIDPMGFG